jgi:N-acetylglucosaminyldiphosphoundecaprenol N-acetyl-beta-D-mannosaminyltransferase
VWASGLFKQKLKERVAGIDLMEKLVELAHQKKYKLFFFGAKEEVVTKLVTKYSLQYSPNIIAGYRNGYFKKEEERRIAEQIAQSNPNILFVAITSPVKENFLYQNKDLLNNVNMIMGVGGSFDVIAGYVKRAPGWMQKIGLEWLFRVYQEPRRMFKRYLVGNLKFMRLVAKYYFKRNRVGKNL